MVNLSDPKNMALFEKFFKLKKIPNFQNFFIALEKDPERLTEIGKFCKYMEEYATPQRTEELEMKIN